MNKWIKGVDYPDFYTEESLATVSKGYLLDGETPRMSYERMSNAAAKTLGDMGLAKKFFDLMWTNKLCVASPIFANLGTDRGLPISCNSVHVGDSLVSIFNKNTELAMLTKHGAGVGIYMGDVRGRGAKIGKIGTSNGIMGWLKVFDANIAATSQGNIRRGAAAIYLPVDHPDFHDFLRMRRPAQEENMRCMNLHHAVTITDEFMHKILAGDSESRNTWKEILATRFETGEPYLFFSDNVNRQLPESYKKNKLKVSTSNICNEIYQYTDENHTFVCCLSSLNLTKWDEITDDDIKLSVYFLDAVMSEYIEKASYLESFGPAINSATKGRALGLGVLGWHTYLQNNMIPFESFRAMQLNNQIFKRISEQADLASQELAVKFGEPEWCIGTGRRNTFTMAVAPTVSNSIISGSVSQGIEPIIANAFAKKSAKGTFLVQNKNLREVLAKYGKDTPDIWTKISTNNGSVQNLSFLSQEEKDVFKTAYEVDQKVIVQQAAQRGKYIDQGQSVNIFFTADTNPKYFNEVHILAWELGLKGLYYCRASTLIKGDVASRGDDCNACQG
jgi:ribonucleoside-diphosphate reductase alpha chain